ncbi:MAG: ABC transporter substrate-binding protein [Propionicimonas sp.]|uniref:ABC transporter substrate-binding protein n=1 Tax=Propionicimonas sp. TaxID=1955623 RepID=UPI002B1F8038|nr:ABC transporter substrate-binding protein [Propionicimonas sp.]MEA4945258.1 ABC transporter substrate-binding protein [Propionicimonas sp.]
MPAEPRRRLAVVVAITALALLAGCTPQPETPPVPDPVPTSATPTATPVAQPFVVLTSGPITTADPAVAVADSDVLIATSVYQRLMRVLPTGELKPDLATDCSFVSETVYECTLPQGLTFQNGDSLTATDVRFSIQRALRLDTPGTSVGLFDSLTRITIPDDLTIRFTLSYADNRFGYALASLAASIVDEAVFNPDAAVPLDAAMLPAGSGPYQLTDLGPEEASFARYEKYVGPLAGGIDLIRLERVADSASAEEAINDGTAGAVWRTLDPPAVKRLTDQIAASPTHETTEGYTFWPMDGAQVTRLIWNPASSYRGNAVLRSGVARALQQDRTLDSLVPVGVEGHLASFPLGGSPVLPDIQGKRAQLTLRYDPSAPGHADAASLIRSRIEELSRVSVRLVTSGDADLLLTDAQPWVLTAVGWLQDYTDTPLPGSADKIAGLSLRARTTNGDARVVALGELQKQAAADLTVLPVSQADGVLVLGRGVTLLGDAFGSGGELGLWGIRNG